MYNFAYLPIMLAFNVNQPTWHRTLDYIIDLVFLADMALTFRTVYHNSNNDMIVDWRELG